MRGQRVADNVDGEIDENFWAQAAAEQANNRKGGSEADEGTWFFFRRPSAESHSEK